MERIVKDFFKFELGLIGIIAAILLLAFCSCSTTEYITVERVRTDTLRQYRNVHDSIYVHDSVSIKEKGDTVRIEKWHTRYIEHEVHDTVYQATHDTIPQPYPYAIYKDRELTTMQVVLMTIGCLAIMALFVFIVVKLKRFLPCR